tara:strand:- start:190 stop:360 length:171 start_codon:yes stop_codon:yes gene_type:complete
MTKKQGVKAVTSYLVMVAQDTAKEALADGITTEQRDYLITKSVIIRDLLKDLKNGN